MTSGLSSPRSRAARAADLGERSVFVARQRVGKGPRRKARQRGRLRRVLPLTALAVAAPLAVAFSAHWLLTTPRFAVVSVDVRGASRVPTAEILAAAAVEPGTSLFRLDPGAVARRVEAIPEVRRADVVREFPNRIVISVEERRPFTLVHSGRLHWLDEEGRGLGGAPRAPRGRARPGGRPGCPRGGSQVPGPGHPPAEALVMRRPKAQNPVVGLDVGTTKICAVIAQPAAHGGLDVVGIGTAPSR